MEISNHAPLIDELLKAVNAHDPDRLLEFYAADYEGLDVSRALRYYGPEGARGTFDAWFRAFPDVSMVSREVCVEAGQIAFFWMAVGTHQGVFMSVPPTGRHVEVCGFSLLTLRHGKIARGLHLWDMAGLLRSMRLLPDLPGVHQPASQADMLSSFLMCL